jgi:hypothetical protein
VISSTEKRGAPRSGAWLDVLLDATTELVEIMDKIDAMLPANDLKKNHPLARRWSKERSRRIVERRWPCG